jgi:hypothetical protein
MEFASRCLFNLVMNERLGELTLAYRAAVIQRNQSPMILWRWTQTGKCGCGPAARALLISKRRYFSASILAPPHLMQYRDTEQHNATSQGEQRNRGQSLLISRASW